MEVSAVYAYLGTELTVFVLVAAFVLGAVFASFITCVAGRLVAGESPWGGRSHCDSCGHDLGPLDLVPILSWVIAGGRCRYCKERIPVRCVLFEVLLGVVFALVFMKFGLTVESLSYCALACVLLGLSLVDLDTMTIPNGFVLAAIVIWGLHLVARGALFLMGIGQDLGSVDGLIVGVAVAEQVGIFASAGNPVVSLALDGLVGGIVLSGCVLGLSLIFDRLLGKQSLGGGDVKLLFAVGLFLGLPLGLFNLILSCILGLVFAFVGQSAGKPFPFGPAISGATVISLLYGGFFVTWYLGFL